jgi:hypothetical protein
MSAKARLVWKHGLRGAITDPQLFSPLAYQAGQRAALVAGETVPDQLQTVLTNAIGVNCFWSSARGKTPYGLYASLPEGCLWLALVAHVAEAKTPQQVTRVAPKPTMEPKKSSSKAAAAAAASKQLRRSPTTNQVAPAAAPRAPRPCLAKALKAIAFKSLCMTKHRVTNKASASNLQLRRQKRDTQPSAAITTVDSSSISDCPKTKAALSNDQPPAKKTKTKTTAAPTPSETGGSTSSAAQTLPWPPLPEHSFNIPGEKDFKQALCNLFLVLRYERLNAILCH